MFIYQWVLWTNVYKDQETIYGFSLDRIVFYYLLVRVISDIVSSNIGFRMTELILDGTISNVLMKQVSIKLFVFVNDLGKLVINLTSKVIIFGSILLIFGQNWYIQIANPGLFFVALVLCLFLSFSLYFLVGCIAFWTQDVRNMNYGIQRMIFFLSGGLIPIAFFPGWMQNVIAYSPFEYMINFPVNILNTSLNNSEVLKAFLVGSLWSIFLWILGSLVLKFSIRNNESVGI